MTVSTLEAPVQNQYENILVAQEGAIATVTLNRPKALNALSPALMSELIGALEGFDKDESVRAIILTGGEKVFAAGADIKAMADATHVDMVLRNQFDTWDRIRKVKKPIIAAVCGYALGGGCELSLMCDMIVASETATFGQPEINIGVIPGAGGTQRLTRAIGKARAMEIVLAGRQFSASEAYEWGMVTRVVPAEMVQYEAKQIALAIASKSPLAVRLAKEAVLKADDAHLEAGLEFERKNFYLLFGSHDQREGMQAFIEKRKPEWNGR